MTPEQVFSLVQRINTTIPQAKEQGMGCLVETLKDAVTTITQLQEQVTELENHNKDKSQLLANYKEQITSLVKEKHRREK